MNIHDFCKGMDRFSEFFCTPGNSGNSFSKQRLLIEHSFGGDDAVTRGEFIIKADRIQNMIDP